ncbi:hypothetical protein L3Y34_012619 [Caenorhabditis briggsae]|uniref:Uncharacterized protein n=1 Tax=Caenorhabditis briggsae TaxID=6238 RepID=A0AAE9CW22_CAEBR|nr:hypothetical protein L3Y34_012619 [Caenorhabditis briggsae]
MSHKEPKKEKFIETDGSGNESNVTETGDEFLKKMKKALEETRKDSDSVFPATTESRRFVLFSPSNEKKLLIDQETFNSQMKKLSFLVKKSSIDYSCNNGSKQCSSASPPGFFSYPSSDESSGEENESYTEDSESETESARIAPIYPAPDRPPGILTTAFQSEESNAPSSSSPEDNSVRRQQSSSPRNVVIPPLLVSETPNNLHRRNNVSQFPPPANDRLSQFQLSTDSSPPSYSGPVEVPPLDTIKSRLESHLLMLYYSKRSNQPGSEGFDQMLEVYKEIILTILYMEEGMTPQEEVDNLEIARFFVYDRLADLEDSEENVLTLAVYKVMNEYLKEKTRTVAFNMLVLELIHLEKIIRQKSKDDYAETERNLFSDIVLC